MVNIQICFKIEYTCIYGRFPFLKVLVCFLSLFFKRFYLFIYLFLERGRQGESEGEKHQCVVASCVSPTGYVAHNPGMCPDCELNRRLFGLQAGAQSTEAHQPGQIPFC